MVANAALSPAVPRPSHVPEALVYDFDYVRDPALIEDPPERALDIARNAPPIFWTPRQGGHWVAASHAANFDVARDFDIFSNVFVKPEDFPKIRELVPPEIDRIPTNYPISLDPPDHGKYRAPLQGAFSPRAAVQQAQEIRDLAGRLIDKVVGQGGCEFMSAIAEPLPVQVFLKMMGLPLSRQAEYRAAVREQLEHVDPDQVKNIISMFKVVKLMRGTLVEREDDPRDDIISLLWNTKIDDQKMTLADMENYGLLLFVAGLDTVMNSMCFGVRHLARNPDLQAMLRAHPERIGAAVEELLRRYSFVAVIRRVAKDVTFHGVDMKEGERTLLFLPSANLDAREFPEPERFDLARENNVHIVFNAGPHRCLGSHLARMELKILYEELLPRLPEFRLDPDRPPKFHGGHVIGFDSLHILWDVQ